MLVYFAMLIKVASVLGTWQINNFLMSLFSTIIIEKILEGMLHSLALWAGLP
jgi:hypothetical protein